MNTVLKYKYQAVADLLRENIRSGLYPTGELPDEKALMKQFDVGKITVYNALKLLTEEGIISRVQGKGTFVNGIFGQSLTISGQVAVIMNHIGHYYSNLARHIRALLFEHCLYSIPVDYLSVEAAERAKDVRIIDRLSLLLNSNIHGVIYDGNGYAKFPFMDNYPHMRSVVVNYFDSPGEACGGAVLIDFEKGAVKAVRYLAGKGHKRILLLTHRPREFPIQDPDHARRHPVNQINNGYLTTMAEYGLAEFCEILLRGEDNIDDLIRGILSRTANRPDAIVCSADNMALKIIMTAFTMGIRIPEDLSVIGMYDTPWAEESPIKITSLSFKEEAIAQNAVRLIAARSWEKETIHIEPELIIRRSA